MFRKLFTRKKRRCTRRRGGNTPVFNTTKVNKTRGKKQTKPIVFQSLTAELEELKNLEKKARKTRQDTARIAQLKGNMDENRAFLDEMGYH
jgi:hypothetical protein